MPRGLYGGRCSIFILNDCGIIFSVEREVLRSPPNAVCHTLSRFCPVGPYLSSAWWNVRLTSKHASGSGLTTLP